MKKKIKILVLVLIFIALIFLGFLFFNREGRVKSGAIKISQTEGKVYVNENFGFSVKIPVGWEVKEYLGVSDVPSIFIYKTKPGLSEPFDPIGNFNHVVFLPKGYSPTDSRSNDFLNFATSTAWKINIGSFNVQYKLGIKESWASKITWESSLKGWTKRGLVWAQADILDLEEVCTRAGQEISIRECNPLEGDLLIRKGSVKSGDAKTLVDIVNSIEILK